MDGGASKLSFFIPEYGRAGPVPTAKLRELLETHWPTSMAVREPAWPVADIRALAELLAPKCVTANPTSQYQDQCQRTLGNPTGKQEPCRAAYGFQPR